MSDIKDFVIEDGALTKYNGPGGDVVIPDGVTSIGDRAFEFCESLKSVVIPEGVTSIGDWAFSHCVFLTSAVIPEGVTSIGEYAFEECISLTSVVIPHSRIKIDRSAFYNCKGLADADGFEIINNVLYGFIPREWDDELLAWFGPDLEGYLDRGKIEIPYGVTRIEEGVFSGWADLESVVIPSSVTSIGKKAFYGCENLTSIVIPSSVTSIGDEAFSGCSDLESVAIQEGVTSIGKDAFYGCENLTSIVIPSSVTSIGERAFYGCENLTNIVISSNATSIEEAAFDWWSGPESLWLKNEAGLENAAWRDEAGYLLAVGEGEAIRFYAAIGDDDYNSYLNSVLTGEWECYDNELMSNAPRSGCRPTARLLAAVDRLRHPVGLSAEAKQAFVKLLRANVKKIIPWAEYFGCPWIIKLLIDEGIINDENRKAVNKLLKASSDPDIAAFAD